MDLFVTICGVIGAWLLVAGPLFQGALELRDTSGRLPLGDDADWSTESSVSAWWWLIPPFAVLVLWLEERRFPRLWRDVWSDEQREQARSFADRATGWLVVSAGAFFIALEVTWLLAREAGWPVIGYWLFVAALTATCVTATTAALSATDRRSR